MLLQPEAELAGTNPAKTLDHKLSAAMKKSVLVISTLDTKGQETLYLKDKLSAIDLQPVLMDISGRGSDMAGIDIPADRVAEAGGGSFEELQASRDRTRVTNIMMAGGCRIARNLLKDGNLDGVIGMGGSTGSLMASEIMRSLPFGVPKVIFLPRPPCPVFQPAISEPGILPSFIR